jgi:hypothetical protein
MDFRQHRHYEVNVPVAYSGDEIGGKGAATNLSVGGCAVLGDCGVRVGSFVELVLHLPAATRRPGRSTGGGPVLRRNQIPAGFPPNAGAIGDAIAEVPEIALAGRSLNLLGEGYS